MLKEICSGLKYGKEITAGIPGGSRSIFSRAMFLCYELLNGISLPPLRMFDFKKAREAGRTRTTTSDEKNPVDERQDSVQTAAQAFVQQLLKRKMHCAPFDVEAIALYLDPRYTSLDHVVFDNG